MTCVDPFLTVLVRRSDRGVVVITVPACIQIHLVSPVGIVAGRRLCVLSVEVAVDMYSVYDCSFSGMNSYIVPPFNAVDHTYWNSPQGAGPV